MSAIPPGFMRVLARRDRADGDEANRLIERSSEQRAGLLSERELGTRDGTRDGTRAEIRAELRNCARAVARVGQVLVRPTHALLTPLEREVARGLGAEVNGTRILGHAFTGVVEDAAHAAGIPPRGTRVVVQPVFSCGICARCQGGLAMHCASRSIAGLDAAAGGLAEIVAVPAANCVPIPKDLDDERAVFAAPLARAIEAVRRGGVEKRTFASVLGDDLSAVLAALVAVEENPLARLVAMHEATLRAAEQFGVRHRALHEIGRRGDQELVIDTTGSAETLAAAARMVQPRGHVVVAGISARAPVAFDLSHIALDEIEVHGSGFGPIAAAVDRLARRTIDPSPLISRRIGFAEAAKALASLGEPGVFSVLVQISR
jgi:threonine dehydrogenase-like Zn-dependent dehydrogenase